MMRLSSETVTNSDVKSYYARHAWEVYWLKDIDDNLVPRDETFRTRLASTLGLVRGTPRTALVVGTGLGLYDFSLCRQHPHLRIWSFDISPQQVACARRLAVQLRISDRIHFFCADAEQIPLRRTFDLILCTEVLEHFPDPGPVLEQVFACADDETQIIISVPQNYQGGQRGIFYRCVGPDDQVLGESGDPSRFTSGGTILWYFHDQYDRRRLHQLLRKHNANINAWTATRFMSWLNHSAGLATLGMGVVARWLFQHQLISEGWANRVTRYRHAEHLIVRVNKKPSSSSETRCRDGFPKLGNEILGRTEHAFKQR
jgi:SAM-dependent methyltransferase